MGFCLYAYCRSHGGHEDDVLWIPKAGLTSPHGVHLDCYYVFKSRCMGLLGL
jgi:hypothetical protein